MFLIVFCFILGTLTILKFYHIYVVLCTALIADRQCPELSEGQIGTCVEMCISDFDCSEGELCCSNGCGHVCMESVLKTNHSEYDCVVNQVFWLLNLGRQAGSDIKQ